MGSKISKLCKDFKLKSTCVSNCCSNGSKNDVNLDDINRDKHKHHKHKHKHKHNDNQEVAG
jgi:hypothetical protein